MKAVYYVPFNATVRLPPPTFRCADGIERYGYWVDVTTLVDTSQRFYPEFEDPSSWLSKVGTK